jgi:hypothetical protein
VERSKGWDAFVTSIIRRPAVPYATYTFPLLKNGVKAEPVAAGIAGRKEVVNGDVGSETLIALIPGTGFLFATNICPTGLPPIVIAP